MRARVRKEEPKLRVPRRIADGLAAGLELAPTAEPVLVVELDGPEELIQIAKAERPVLAVLDDGDGARAAALAAGLHAFAMPDRPGVLFGSTVAPAEGARVEAVKAHAVSRLIRKGEEEPAPEERFLLGVVLEPDVVDSQRDTYSAAEVRKAAHGWMESYGQLGKQHSEIVTGKLKILESYVAPVAFDVGAEAVKAGTWLLAIRVVDDDLWAAVKAGTFTGFSIGGTAVRRPDGVGS